MHKKRVVMIDDNPEDCRIVERALSDCYHNARLETFTDPGNALEEIRSDHLQPDLILLDLKMPKVDGQQVLRQIRSETKLRNIPIVVLTNTDEPVEIKECYKLGANSFIQKPLDVKDYNLRVCEVVKYWLEVNIDGIH